MALLKERNERINETIRQSQEINRQNSDRLAKLLKEVEEEEDF